MTPSSSTVPGNSRFNQSPYIHAGSNSNDCLRRLFLIFSCPSLPPPLIRAVLACDLGLPSSGV